MSAYSELTFFKRLQVVSVLHACFLLIVFLCEAFLGFELIAWWIESAWARFAITIFLWFVGPKIIAVLNIKV